MSSLATVGPVELLAPVDEASSRILTPEALAFMARLHTSSSAERKRLLDERREKRAAIEAGALPDFLPETESVRSSEWKISEIPADLRDRRVEITGPAGDRKMVVNALNSGASTYMADFEDSQSPTWSQTIGGQVNLKDAVDRSIKFVSPEGKVYDLAEHTATLIVRPRGWHLLEKHIKVQGEPVSASVFDFAIFLFHNAEALRKIGSGPYFYLPKLESHLEARLWERVITEAEELLGLPRGTVKVTVLIETLTAGFEMDEILYELRDHVVGLNCGRWDYIFSYIKNLRSFPRFVLPDRALVTMEKAFLSAYVDLLIKTCHRRGAYAIGGMSAYIPVKTGEEANALAMRQVKSDKEREVKLGHDGTWVAHPGLVPLAREVFDSGMPGDNQLHVLREEITVTRDDLLRAPDGSVTLEGVRTNVGVGLRYLESWLAGRGCVPINNLMEDAATAEISRAQLWQWVRHGVRTAEGTLVNGDVVATSISEAVSDLAARAEAQETRERLALAGNLFQRITTEAEFPDFLTLPAYDELIRLETEPR